MTRTKRFRSCGGDEGDRTPYLLHAMQALSQVSYTPTLAHRTYFRRLAYYSNPSGKCQGFFWKKILEREYSRIFWTFSGHSCTFL